ncbi:hypothetical protein QVD17_01001 [Tagetes erecta]|uniref:Uncharacterized protein n=1 Tax=Tagetes erecta TaxID=13708 RepID=A0AAD8P129_TARER|nr:hypothetical protein QVD17_01001 [Tagetes erecta]
MIRGRMEAFLFFSFLDSKYQKLTFKKLPSFARNILSILFSLLLSTNSISGSSLFAFKSSGSSLSYPKISSF